MKKHLKFYKKYYNKHLPDGLCDCAIYGLISMELLELFEPTYSNESELRNEGKPFTYWGQEDYSYDILAFTPLRQTVILFMAAINNEL